MIWSVLLYPQFGSENSSQKKFKTANCGKIDKAKRQKKTYGERGCGSWGATFGY